MKKPRRLFNRPSPEVVARIIAEAEEATKDLPSRDPDCPPAYLAMLDDLILKTFGDVQAVRDVVPALRDTAETAFMATIQARRDGVTLEALLFEQLTAPYAAGVDESMHDFGDPVIERLIRFCWGVLDARDRSA